MLDHWKVSCRFIILRSLYKLLNAVMKFKLSVLILFLILSHTAKSTVWTITNSGLTFSPNLVTITFGDTVLFNIAGSHDAREVSMATWTANGNTALVGGFQTPFGGGFVLPSQLAVGTHYFVCTPHASSNMKGRIVVNPCNIPGTPGPISGSATVCESVAGNYSVAAVSGATSYTWSLPSGWTGTSTSTSISATSGVTSGNITVTANNGCGSSSAQSISVTVNPLPATPGNITGSTTICEGSTNNYSISPVVNATSYTWIFPSMWAGASNADTVSANAGVSGIIQVTANNSCGSSVAQNLSVTVNTIPASPGAISGDTIVCLGSSALFSVSSVSGAADYTWILPSGWNGSSTTNSISVNAVSGSGVISITANNSCGSSASQSINVTTDTVPDKPSSLVGDLVVCNGSTINYTASTVSGASDYQWTLPSGWTLLNNGFSVNVIAGSLSGVVAVAAGNTCGYSDTVALNVIANTADTSITQTGNVLTANASNSLFQWIDCNSNTPINGEVNAGFTPTVTGDYAVIVNSNGCIDTSSCFNVVVVGINEANHTELVLYPNPSEGIIYLSGLNKNTITKIEVINTDGQIVYTDSNTDIINLKKLESGIYMIVAVTSEGVFQKKLFIK